MNAVATIVPVAPVRRIQRAVCRHFDVELTALLSDRRPKRLSWPRQVAMYLAAELTSHSVPAIGAAFRRDHTTVLHACRRVEEAMASDPEARTVVLRIRRDLETDRDSLLEREALEAHARTVLENRIDRLCDRLKEAALADPFAVLAGLEKVAWPLRAVDHPGEEESHD